MRLRATMLLLGGLGGPLGGQDKGSPAAKPPTITSVSAVVSIGGYMGGPCPANLKFSATITAAAVPTAPITYQWVSSDKTKGPVRKLAMTGKTAVVTDTWKVGASGEMVRVWRELHVLTPNAVTSNQANSAVLCR